MKKLFFFSLLICAAWINCTLAQDGKPLFTHAIGVQAYTYRNSFPNGVAAVLDSVKALGITEMEGPNPKNISPEEFKKMLDDRGISMPSIGIDYNAIVKDPEAAIKLAKVFGSKFIMVAWIPHGKTFTIDDAKKAVTDFNRVGKILKENDITFCYHDHGYEFGPYGDGTLFDYIVQNTNPKYVSFEMDLMWTFHGGANPAQLLYKYKGRWKMVHLKDIRKGIDNDLTGGTNTHNDVAVGTGQLNYPEIIKAAKAVNIKHYFIEDESPDHAIQIPVTIAYLRGLKK
ncbi:sugar phosphate isomerase/epimerase [Mucilaginibacter frigoritolerans]|jgi:sugar phosphate isomerase/epimerase|uniref:Sugar phosphate isomerase/epimerase n=1 Tax=Mucilaginibacter frigoritolerans TaxID=652788 RepID=A0A562UA65_9SPHI|nr:sugar phosphate isomerase/epimerase [Mucilaginibacter frigoritolerans]TWJ02519.1 sugar phosphate isomerase/epimerase [Mucilaginibacter frigoritolerans]